MKPPVIGVVSTLGEDKSRPYQETIAAHGGEPILLQAGIRFEALALQGILLTGGGDLSEPYYDHALTEKERKTLGTIEPEREQYEHELLKWALRQKLPLLGICRGCQMMNVFAEGTLIPDLAIWSSQQNKAIPSIVHRQMENPSQPTHAIDLDPQGQLHQIFKTQRLNVNSSHHQAIGRCGKNLSVTARAPDGVIEGIEDLHQKFWIGVQFHPERMWKQTSVFSNLFRELIEQARHVAVQASEHV